MDSGIAGETGFLFLIPLSIVFLISLISGMWLCLRHRQQAEFRILFFSSLVFIAEIVTEAGPTRFYHAVILVYATLSTLLPVRWFLFLRKQQGYPD